MAHAPESCDIYATQDSSFADCQGRVHPPLPVRPHSARLLEGEPCGEESGIQPFLIDGRSHRGRVHVLSRLCLWTVPHSAVLGSGFELYSTHCLSAHFIIMCKLSPSKAFRTMCTDANTLKKEEGHGELGPLPLESSVGCGGLTEIFREMTCSVEIEL